MKNLMVAALLVSALSAHAEERKLPPGVDEAQLVELVRTLDAFRASPDPRLQRLADSAENGMSPQTKQMVADERAALARAGLAR